MKILDIHVQPQQPEFPKMECLSQMLYLGGFIQIW